MERPALFSLPTPFSMRQELESIRQALLARDALDGEAQEALASLETALAEIDGHPAGARVREVVSGTAASLSADDVQEEGTLSATWDELKGNLEDWEKEHPGLVLVIGRLSNSLAALGL